MLLYCYWSIKISNGIILQFGYVDNGSDTQNVSKLINLPISFHKKYSCVITSINGKGIPGCTNLTISQFGFNLYGPWNDWPSRYGCWICIGY